MSTKGYDSRCEELARVFLDDGEHSQAAIDRAAPKLAQAIQDCIEDTLSDPEFAAENPRQRGDDDGVEYADPRDVL